MRVGITGLSGSLGTALADELSQTHVVVGITRDELKAEKIAARYLGQNVRAMVVAAGLADRDQLCRAFDGCEWIIHAAALKRISGSVYATEEILKTNVLGTMHVLHAARAVGAKKVVVVSSDKAVEATNLYGASKFCAECLAVQENAFSYPKGMRTIVVRYGNVLGSRGSVVHIWRDIIRRGEPLNITDGSMTRFIITMREAVQLVLTALRDGLGGEIFVPVLQAAYMRDLGAALAWEAGHRTYAFHENGLRPGGEKLHESLLSQEELLRTLVHPSGRLLIPPGHRSWSAEPYAGDFISQAPYRSDSAQFYSVADLVELLQHVPHRDPND